MSTEPARLPSYFDQAPDDVHVAKFLKLGRPFFKVLGPSPPKDQLNATLGNLVNMWNLAVLQVSGSAESIHSIARALLPADYFGLFMAVAARKRTTLPDERWFIINWRLVPGKHRRWALHLTAVEGDEQAVTARWREADPLFAAIDDRLQRAIRRAARREIPAAWARHPRAVSERNLVRHSGWPQGGDPR